MNVCKWCREPIRKSVYFGLGKSIPEWVHVGGYYGCIFQSTNVAQPADLRWERVYLEIGKPEITDDDLTSGRSKFLKELLEVRMSVWYKGIQVYHVTRIHEATMRNMYPQFDIIKMTLDKSVQKIDDYMEEMDSERTA